MGAILIQITTLVFGEKVGTVKQIVLGVRGILEELVTPWSHTER